MDERQAGRVPGCVQGLSLKQIGNDMKKLIALTLLLAGAAVAHEPESVTITPAGGVTFNYPEPPVEPTEPPVVEPTEPIGPGQTFAEIFEFVGGFRPYAHRTRHGWQTEENPREPDHKNSPEHTLAFADGAIAHRHTADGVRIIMSGHNRGNYLTEFVPPNPVKSEIIGDWPIATEVTQALTDYAGRIATYRRVKALHANDDGSLYIGNIKPYDSNGSVTHGSQILSDASDIAGSETTPLLDTPGDQSQGMCWVSEIPAELRARFNADTVWGGAVCRTSITSRHSQGPSAFVGTMPTMDAETIEHVVMQNYPDGSQMGGQRPDERGSIARWRAGGTHVQGHGLTVRGPWPWPGHAPAWTVLSGAEYGFLLPDGRYLAFGVLAGVRGGLGYKGPWTADGPHKFACDYEIHGWCTYERGDYQDVMWTSDSAEWGNVDPHLIVPTVTELPEWLPRVAGGSWDSANGTLYLSHLIGGNRIAITVWRARQDSNLQHPE